MLQTQRIPDQHYIKWMQIVVGYIEVPQTKTD